jgi:UDP-N-acetyl-D-mannosaminuronic acid dehydrogenase
MLGTPVDHENNPILDALFDFVDNTLVPFMKKGVLVLLRSTVAPGTTERVRDRIKRKSEWVEGLDYHLVFCPERVLQTKSIEETEQLPQIIGAFSTVSYDIAKDFNLTYNNNDQLYLTPREAEIGKLMTNMYRYVTFALANEFWIIGEKQGVNIEKVTKAINHNYNRMGLPLPGPNVGGPCLFKDGRFLVSDIPFGDLISTSFLINEGMPDYIFNRIKFLNSNIKKCPHTRCHIQG